MIRRFVELSLVACVVFSVFFAVIAVKTCIEHERIAKHGVERQATIIAISRPARPGDFALIATIRFDACTDGVVDRTIGFPVAPQEIAPGASVPVILDLYSGNVMLKGFLRTPFHAMKTALLISLSTLAGAIALFIVRRRIV